MSRLAFIGLGNLGTPIANNLGAYAKQHALPPLPIWHRSASKYSDLSEDNQDAFLAETLEEIPARSDIIFTCLLNDSAAEDVYTRLFSGEGGKIFADHSTIGPATASRLAREAGSTYLSCPVFGQPAAAKTAQLLVVLAGDESIKERLREILIPAVGRAVIDAGPQACQGATLKLLGNSTILGSIQLLAESFAISEKVGFETSVFHDFIQHMYPTPVWKNYGARIAEGSFDKNVGFRIEGGLKDANHILALDTSDKPYRMPIIERAKENMERASELGGKDQEWSSLAIAERENAGLSPHRQRES